MSDRETRFDAELRRAARSLVTEDLPRGVLDESVGAAARLGRATDGSVAVRRPFPGLGVAAAAVVVLVLASAVAFAPRLPGGPGPSPTVRPAPTTAAVFRSTTSIRADLLTLSYTCHVGGTVAPSATGPDVAILESAVCLPPTDGKPYLAAVIVGESAIGGVVEVHMKGDLVGGDLTASRTALGEVLGKAAAVVVVEGSGTPVGTWVTATQPTLDNGDSAATTIAGVRLELARSATGSYTLQLTAAAPGT